MDRKIKIGMLQMRVEYHDPMGNLARAETLTGQAAAMGAEICILPECMDLGWATPEAGQYAQPVPGSISDRLCEIARKNHVWLVSGLTEQVDNRLYNAAVLISADGEILLKHRKINILSEVEQMYSVGDRLGVAETPFGTIGISICADNLSPSLCLGHSLARMGAQLLLSPSAWAVVPDRDETADPYGAEWHEPYSTLSSLYQIPVVGVSNVGSMPVGAWKSWKAIGNSIAYDSDGSCAAVLPYGEDAQTVHIVEVTVRKSRRFGTDLAEAVCKQDKT